MFANTNQYICTLKNKGASTVPASHINIFGHFTMPEGLRIVFGSGPGDWGSIQGRVISDSKKWYLMPPCLTLSIIRYGSRVNLSNPRKGVALSPIPWCSSYWKGSLWVALKDNCQQLLISCRGIRYLQKFCSGYDTNLHLMVWLQF